MNDTDGQTGVKAILIAGPTASGKSKFAMELAAARRGVVINADSMQVYRELHILTARPSSADEAACAHRLYGHVSLANTYSVASWLCDVEAEINHAYSNGHIPIIVGGTGLYFTALTQGLAPVPEIAPEVRAKWRRLGITGSKVVLHTRLRQLDPKMAERLLPTDRQRVVRALEVIEGTGKSLLHWQAQVSSPVLAESSYAGFVIDRPREEIYRACNARLDAMVEAGALDEVQRVRDMQLKKDLPGMRALGLPPLLAYLEGEMSLEAALEVAKRDTRRYAKRQLTWSRNNMIAWKRLNMEEMERNLAEIFPFIDD